MKGLRELLKEIPPTDVTVEDVKEYVKDIFERRASNIEKTFTFKLGEISPGVYLLHDGTLTGKGGWDLYNKIIQEELALESTCPIISKSGWADTPTITHTPLPENSNFSSKEYDN